MEEALTVLASQAKDLLIQEDIPRYNDCISAISRLTKDLRVEQEKADLLLTLDEHKAIDQTLYKALLTKLWEHAPDDLASKIVMETDKYIRETYASE